MNLGWKLAAEVLGRAPDGLLDTYHSERHPVAARVLWNVRAQNALARPSTDVDALRELFTDLLHIPEVNARLSGMISGVDIRYDVGSPGAGALVPDIPLKDAGRLVEALRAGRPLLVLTDGQDALRRLVPPGVDVHLTAGTDADAVVGPVLVRPDGYAVWTGHDGPDGLRRALTRWLGK